MKECTSCGERKPIEQFNRNKRAKDGRVSACKKCIKARNQVYYQKNKEKIQKYLKEYWKDYYKENKEKFQEQARRYFHENKQTRYKYWNNRRETDPLYRLRMTLGCRLHEGLKNNTIKKTQKAEKYFGASYPVIKAHIEKQFSEGMSWENHGEWHIDHIIPISSATTEEELIKLYHYKNLQPLWASDNLSKGAKKLSGLTF